MLICGRFKLFVFLNEINCCFKAIEDEGGDPENFEIQLSGDSVTPRKGGKAKGMLFCRRDDVKCEF